MTTALGRLQKDVKRRNQRKKFQPHYFAIGDRVLVWVFNPKNKFQKRWVGPFRIVEHVSINLWEVQALSGPVLQRGRQPNMVFLDTHLKKL